MAGMQKYRKSWRCAVLLLSVIVFSQPVFVSAEELEQKSENQIENAKVNVETDVYEVIMPTVPEGVFDFILDPQGLINETNGAMYAGQKFEADSTVFFKRTDGQIEYDYSNKSDAVTITNKSSVPVDIFLDIRVAPSSLNGIVMTEDRSFTNDTNPSLYLAVTDGEKEIPIGREGVSIDVTVDAALDGSYEYVYDNDKEEYVYQLKNNLDNSVFSTYSFQLTGAANGNGDWSKLDEAAPKLLITWKVSPRENIEPRKDAVLNREETSEENQEPGDEALPQKLGEPVEDGELDSQEIPEQMRETNDEKKTDGHMDSEDSESD